MFHVGRFDPADLREPDVHGTLSEGYRRAPHINRGVGSVHTDLGTCELAPGGSLELHVHSYEESVFVLEGAVVVTTDGTSRVLGAGECAFFGVGSTHGLANAGDVPARWIDLVTPQARGAAGPPDTWWTGRPAPAEAAPLDVRDPRVRTEARWLPEQMDLDLVRRRSEVDAPTVSASMTSALLAYSGIAVKMLIDERHGAALGNVFMVDYRDDTLLHLHDHPIEEAFYMLEGEVTFLVEGEEHVLGPGGVAYAGVGSIHGFENRSGRPCRWLETRAPMPPLRHAYRYERDWSGLPDLLAAERAATTPADPA